MTRPSMLAPCQRTALRLSPPVHARGCRPHFVCARASPLNQVRGLRRPDRTKTVKSYVPVSAKLKSYLSECVVQQRLGLYTHAKRQGTYIYFSTPEYSVAVLWRVSGPRREYEGGALASSYFPDSMLNTASALRSYAPK